MSEQAYACHEGKAVADGAAILIAGPTASGKSALALDLALRIGGVVINADSMQVYDGLSILTARPSPAEMACAPHLLYGHVPATRVYSVGDWRRDVDPILMQLAAQRRIAIVCGGTGLYFRALLGGIDDMPPIAPERRAFWRARMAAEGAHALHDELAAHDAAAAAGIARGDPQRILRAIEIVEATGRPLTEARTGGSGPLIDAARAVKIVLTPPRDVLRQRIADRFQQMMAAGALEEARRFLDVPGAAEGTAGKAIGIAELGRYLRGDIGLDEAIALAVTRSRQYAKRQDTWFRHQFAPDWLRCPDAATLDLSGVAQMACDNAR